MRVPHFITPLGYETLTRIRAELVEDTVDNSMNRDWDNAQEDDILFCEVQEFILSSRLAFEVNVGREEAAGSTRFWVPTEDILYTDRVRWRGITFEVVGQPKPWTYRDGRFCYLAFLGKERLG